MAAPSILELGQLAAVAATITKVLDTVRHALDKSDRIPKAYWQALSFAVGIATSFGLHVDAVSTAVGIQLSNGIGRIITGLALGGGASVIHDLLDSGAPAPTPKGLKPAPPSA
jgi:hypothetical protein